MKLPPRLKRLLAPRCWLCGRAPQAEMRRYCISGQNIRVCERCQDYAEARRFPRARGQHAP